MRENTRWSRKATRYAMAYNKLLSMIRSGLYPEGSKLPTEPLLAEQLGISRSTLRQALALLQEDGILEARKGIGNFVRKTLDSDNVGLERMGNPFYKSCMDAIDRVEIEMAFEASTAHTQRVFSRKIPVVLAIYRYYKGADAVRGSCFSHVATDFDYMNNLDLNNEQDVLDFLETGIYDYGLSSMLEFRVVPATENIKEAFGGNPSRHYQMIAETISDATGKVIAYNKYYIPFERASFKVFRRN